MPESRPGCLVVLLIEVVVESDLDRWADDNFILYITDFEMIDTCVEILSHHLQMWFLICESLGSEM